MNYFFYKIKVKDVNLDKVEKTYSKVTEKTNIPILTNFQTWYALKALISWQEKGSAEE